jgi:hypothetical protein
MTYSDHSTVIWLPNSEIVKKPNSFIKRTIRPIKDSGIRDFGSWISQCSWAEVEEADGTESKTEAFYDIMLKGIDKYFPTREIKIHVSDKPWISSKTKELIRKRQEVFTPERPLLWRCYRNKVQRAIVKDKKEYYHNRVQRLKRSNPASWYREIRVMTTNNKSQTSIQPPPGVDPSNASDVAQSINDHFVSIGSDIKPLVYRNCPHFSQLQPLFLKYILGMFIRSFQRSKEIKRVGLTEFRQK